MNMRVLNALNLIANSALEDGKNLMVHSLPPADCGHKSAVVVVHPCHCGDPKCKTRQAIRELNAWCERHLGESAIPSAHG